MQSSETVEKQSWQARPATQLLAVAVVCLAPYAFAIWSQLSRDSITLKELFLFPLLVGGGGVALVLLAHRFVCGERIASLNLKSGKCITDILAGVSLAAVFLGLFALQQAVQATWFPIRTGPPPKEIVTLFRGIANDPILLAVWIGPVAWLGVAGFEELTRVFMLNRLWAIWPRPTARLIAMIVSAVLFGLGHIYQGPVNAVAIGVQGFLYACYYLRFGRVWPMIIGHALYDSLQVVQVAAAFGGG
jgi:membrane protease YdiL (CAAX protease family)